MANHCICPRCHLPMRVETQSSMLPGRPSFEIATCDTASCWLNGVTLTLGEHHVLTQAQIASYREMNARRRERLARAAVLQGGGG